MRETVVVLKDDLSGGPADETVTYSLDGVAYEIDLSAKNAKRFRKAMAEFVDGSRRAGKVSTADKPAKAKAKRGRPAGSARKTTAPVSAKDSSRPNPAAVREWAEKNGREVPKRGRLSADLVAAYLADTSSAPASTEQESAVSAA